MVIEVSCPAELDREWGGGWGLAADKHDGQEESGV